MNGYDVIVAIIFAVALIFIVWFLIQAKPNGIDGSMNLQQVCAIVDGTDGKTDKLKNK